MVIVTDGTAPDRSYDIWRDMKVFQVIHRLHEHNDRLARRAGFWKCAPSGPQGRWV